MDNILINEEELASIISKLDERIKKLEDIHNELDSKVKDIDGSSEIWSGETQKKAYDNYLEYSKDFTNSINNIKSLKIFLENTLNNYLNSDKKINDSIDKNEDNLDIN